MINELKKTLLETGYFINNEFLTAYLKLVEDNYVASAKNGYTELHHVIPAALYGYINNTKTTYESRKYADADTKNLIILLLYKDHVLAHYLLYFCTTGKLKKAMGRVLFLMTNALGVDTLSTDVFQYLPEMFDSIQQLIEAAHTDPESSFFTPNEVEFLKANYTEAGPKFCAEQLGRPKSAIINKAHRLHLRYNSRKNWTDEEIQIIKQNYAAWGTKVCVDLLEGKHPCSSINTLAKRLGLQPKTGCHKWTPGEEQFLLENYLAFGADYCATQLKRSVGSIEQRAIRLGLYKITCWTAQEDALLIENYSKGVDYCTKLFGRTANVVKARAAKLGITAKRSGPWKEAELQFLIVNYPKLGVNACAEALNKDTSVVKACVRKLGLKSNVFWQDEEIVLLCENASKGIDYCTALIKKSRAAIIGKARALGITFERADKWSQDEITFLKNNYQQFGAAYCAKALPNRTIGVIRTKASQLGLSKNKAWTDEDIEFLKKNYSRGASYCAEYLTRSPAVIRDKASKLGLTTDELPNG